MRTLPFALALTGSLLVPLAARAQSLVVGMGGGPSIPEEAVLVGDGRADPGLGYAGRAFVWWTPETTFAAGITALHVRAPSAGEISTLTFVGLGGSVGSDPHGDAAISAWLALGVGHSRGACSNSRSGEFGVRGDHRVSGAFRLGASLALTLVPTGCGGVDDSASSTDASNAAVLGAALTLSIDLVFELIPSKDSVKPTAR